MRVLRLHSEIQDYLKKNNLVGKFAKQKKLFEANPFHPSLHTELLQPKNMRIWSFRLDVKYRAIFIFWNKNEAEIIEVNNHYR